MDKRQGVNATGAPGTGGASTSSTGRASFEAVPWAAGGLEGEAERLVFERSSPGRRASSFPDGGELPALDL
jgi:hypothetical protein